MDSEKEDEQNLESGEFLLFQVKSRKIVIFTNVVDILIKTFWAKFSTIGILPYAHKRKFVAPITFEARLKII